MAVIKSTACRSSYGRLTYIFNQSAHNTSKTDHRVLACSGTNIKMLHDPSGHLSTIQSGVYLEKQFHQTLRRAYNPKRKYQTQSIIISFSDEEFDTKNLDQQVSQASRLVQGYVHQYFGDTQNVSCVQCDGDGGRLHVHLLINTIKPNGKTVPTNRFSVYRMRNDWNKYSEQHFQQITGRQWKNSFEESDKKRRDSENISTRSTWEKQLKQTIDQVKQGVRNVADFLSRLSDKGIHVKERGKKKRWTYTQIVTGKNGKPKLKRVRAFYQRKDKQGNVLSTRGLGKAYTKQGLEDYWQEEREKEIVFTPKHNRKDVVTDDKTDVETNVQTEREELIRIKTIAQEARAAADHQQRRNQLNLRQLQAAEAREQKQRSQSQTGPVTEGQRNQGRHQSISQQRRLATATQRHVREQQERAKRNNSKDVEPDF
ncbi:relaxase/mobilization nuclease domain-containing protein [Limosilactobacillus reuteri]|uniref:relaxase/mobilization nuclease domain-containing protein n=1 Tax=Limosilactobacillus reuteri TaxID=1598 RepID=UPI00128E034E|nr:relaxase/mobilization nuclease domain-containing protein [Limosilactobacillus reuteri]MCC4482776.1 relaxase/mobilization nuclease domain-containing protein [Limosilactobacillus reuteri]MQB63675.1 mobilization protein [Limosilactobacillus reuteri]MQB68059.1 mobilization protein [Limosilactobacillus reuteri]MQB94098.1 mobilization protein [Limosilactobacillus reuteri]